MAGGELKLRPGNPVGSRALNASGAQSFCDDIGCCFNGAVFTDPAGVPCGTGQAAQVIDICNPPQTNGAYPVNGLPWFIELTGTFPAHVDNQTPSGVQGARLRLQHGGGGVGFNGSGQHTLFMSRFYPGCQTRPVYIRSTVAQPLVEPRPVAWHAEPMPGTTFRHAGLLCEIVKCRHMSTYPIFPLTPECLNKDEAFSCMPPLVSAESLWNSIAHDSGPTGPVTWHGSQGDNNARVDLPLCIIPPGQILAPVTISSTWEIEADVSGNQVPLQLAFYFGETLAASNGAFTNAFQASHFPGEADYGPPPYPVGTRRTWQATMAFLAAPNAMAWRIVGLQFDYRTWWGPLTAPRRGALARVRLINWQIT